MEKDFKIIITFSANETLTKQIRAKNKEEAFNLLFETSNGGWLIEVSDIKDINYNLKNAIKIEVVDVDKENKHYAELAKNY